MTSPHRSSCTDIRPLMAASVLGLAEPEELRRLDEHLSWCHDCVSVQAELAPLPELLATVDPRDVTGDLPALPTALLERTLDEAAETAQAAQAAQAAAKVTVLRRRRRIRVTIGTALAGVAATTLLVVVAPWNNSDPGAATTVVASVADSSTHVTGNFVITAADTGSQVRVQLAGVRPGQHCSLVTLADGGRREVAASWVVRYDGSAEVTGHSGLAPSDVTGLEVVTQNGRTLLRADPSDLHAAS